MGDLLITIITQASLSLSCPRCPKKGDNSGVLQVVSVTGDVSILGIKSETPVISRDGSVEMPLSALETLNRGIPCDQHSPDLSPWESTWIWSRSRRGGREEGRTGRRAEGDGVIRSSNTLRRDRSVSHFPPPGTGSSTEYTV